GGDAATLQGERVMWTFGKKIALGFALAFLLMLVIGGTSYRMVESLTRTSYAVSHTNEELYHLSNYVRIVSDIESQQRGYLLTGNEDYLPQMKDSLAALSQPVEQLRKLIANPAMQQQLSNVIKRGDTKVAYSLKLVEAYKAENKEAGSKEGRAA